MAPVLRRSENAKVFVQLPDRNLASRERELLHFGFERFGDVWDRKLFRVCDAEKRNDHVRVADSVHRKRFEKGSLGKQKALEQHFLCDVHADALVFGDGKQRKEEFLVGIGGEFDVAMR